MMFQKNDDKRQRLEIKYVALNELKHWPRNPKRHDLELIGGSIKNYGMRKPIVVNRRNMEIEAGNGRLDSLIELRNEGKEIPDYIIEKDGDWQVPVLFFDDDEVTQAKFAIVDNQATIKEGWDNEVLLETLNYVYDLDGLEYTGFDEKELEELKQEYGEVDVYAGKDADAVPEVPKEARTKVGDIYELPARCGGFHRVMCGDSTIEEDVEKLMDGKKADMVFTDPPYGIGKDIANDDLSEDELKKFNEKWLIILNSKVKENSHFVCFHSPRLFITVLYFALKNWKFERYLSLYKPNDCTFPWQGWILKSESILVFSRGKPMYNKIEPYLHDTMQHTHGNEQKEYRGDHPSVKPISFIDKFLLRFDAVLVLDLFIGSGTTLIACEKQDRICYGMEIEPLYCDVTVQRYVDFTGNNKIKLNGKDIIW